MTLNRALEVSCDTIFYRLAHEQWLADGGSNPVDDPRDLIASTASDFGFGRRTGIDLPGRDGGPLASREAKQPQWDAASRRVVPAGRGRATRSWPTGERARFLTRLAAENCSEGMRWRVGDALNAAIGQGDTAATVLQVATAYAAIANGGTVYRPQVSRALLNADGSVDQTFAPEADGQRRRPAEGPRLPAPRAAGGRRERHGPQRLRGVPAWMRSRWQGKTGTGEVYGKQATSWFASFAPADDPRYAVVIMVSQARHGRGDLGAERQGHLRGAVRRP